MTEVQPDPRAEHARTVFVSGCYDILHAGHLQFFEEARALGHRLVVSFASNEVLWHYKKRRSSIPDDHKRRLLAGLKVVDEVVLGTDLRHPGLDFEAHFRRLQPDILVVTEDDQYAEPKRRLCEEVGARYLVLPKTPPQFEPVSTSSIVRWIQAPTEAPLRVDFAGGWLDVPRFARPGARVVNCSISPLVSLREWNYEKCSGLGGSGAWALLHGQCGIDSELRLGVGWQDPAAIRETGLCVWESGQEPALDFKDSGSFLRGVMALRWTGRGHDTPALADHPRNYDLIERAGLHAAAAVRARSLSELGQAVRWSYEAQLDEGMEALPELGSLARKYCGGGWGGYALYLYADAAARRKAIQGCPDTRPVEPFLRL